MIPESTIESAERRGFIKKAALATAAVAAGSTILGNQVIPQSGAEKAAPESSSSYVCLKYSLSIDRCNACNGSSNVWIVPHCGAPYTSQLVMGEGCCDPLSSERIGSQRNTTTYKFHCPSSGECVSFPPGNNLDGLDFYTGGTKRVSITNSGNVGIGTCSPNSPLSVGETIGDKIFLFDYPDVKYGLSVFSCQLRVYHGPQSTNFTSFGNYNGTTFTELMRLNNQGQLGIGTTTPATSLQINGSLSAKTITATSNYKMKATDFAVFANGKIKVTLPPAKTALGMIVFVKNVSVDKVTIEAFKNSKETDTVEGAASKVLKKQYDSLTLLSNGSNEWLVLTGSIDGKFTS